MTHGESQKAESLPETGAMGSQMSVLYQPSDWPNRILFAAQGLNGVHIRCLVGGEKAKEYSDEG